MSGSAPDTRAIEATTAHRPWPLPRTPWVMFQSWQRLLFMHWPVPADQLRPLVPPALTLEEHSGSAWLGMTPFLLADLHPRGLPAFPPVSTFPELNVRTYVRVGDQPGIAFFSLDAGSRLAVQAARTFYRLPYQHASMSIEELGDDTFEYSCVRDGGEARFRARYRGTGPAATTTQPGSLEHFLTERYRLYTVLRDGSVLAADIHHQPWRIRSAEAEIRENTMPAAAGIRLPDAAPLLHLAETQDTLVWLPSRP